MFLYNTFTNVEPQIIQNNVRKNNLIISTNINYSKGFLQNIEDDYNELLATITIDKISLYDKPIYKKYSKKNNIEKNITILKESTMPDNDKSIIFLIAHSGQGEIAHFKSLYKLKINDLIKINYNNKIYLYKVTNIYETQKNGYLELEHNYQKELILSTCSQNEEKQLIVDCILIN